MPVSDEQIQDYKEKIERDSEGSYSCPQCGYNELSYVSDTLSLDGTQLTTHIECPSCGLAWDEVFAKTWTLVEAFNFQEVTRA